MMWALVFMATSGRIIPEYVELYQSRTECVSHIPKTESFFQSTMAYCVPVSK